MFTGRGHTWLPVYPLHCTAASWVNLGRHLNLGLPRVPRLPHMVAAYGINQNRGHSNLLCRLRRCFIQCILRSHFCYLHFRPACDHGCYGGGAVHDYTALRHIPASFHFSAAEHRYANRRVAAITAVAKVLNNTTHLVLVYPRLARCGATRGQLREPFACAFANTRGILASTIPDPRPSASVEQVDRYLPHRIRDVAYIPGTADLADIFRAAGLECC